MSKEDRKIRKAIKATKKGKFAKARRKLSKVPSSTKSKTAAAYNRRAEYESKSSPTASRKIGGSQGARAGMRDKGGKNRMITKNFRESIPLAKTPRPRKKG